MKTNHLIVNFFSIIILLFCFYPTGIAQQNKTKKTTTNKQTTTKKTTTNKQSTTKQTKKDEKKEVLEDNNISDYQK